MVSNIFGMESSETPFLSFVKTSSLFFLKEIRKKKTLVVAVVWVWQGNRWWQENWWWWLALDNSLLVWLTNSVSPSLALYLKFLYFNRLVFFYIEKLISSVLILSKQYDFSLFNCKHGWNLGGTLPTCQNNLNCRWKLLLLYIILDFRYPCNIFINLLRTNYFNVLIACQIWWNHVI